MVEKSPSFTFADVRIEPDTFKVLRNDVEISLEPRTFDVLLYLIRNRSRVVEKAELLEAVWKDTFVTENAMTREIAKLRKALGDDPKEPRCIQTIHTRGYRFVAEVTESLEANQGENEVPPASILISGTDGGLSPVAMEEVATTSTSHQSNATKGPVSTHRSFPLVLVLLLVVGIAGLVSGIWGLLHRKTFQRIALTRVAQLTNSPGLDDFPSLSPDGNFVAYASDHNGSFEIYVRQLASGSRDLQITSGGGQNFQPAWSPDGRFVAYFSQSRGGIWLSPATGGESRQLTDFGSHPAWSPDSRSLAFQSSPLTDLAVFSRNALPPSTLWIVNADGGQPRQITQAGKPAGGHGAPSFSPDGKRLAFEVDEYSSSSVWTVAVDGHDQHQIVEKRATEPVYAPDGRSLLYTAGAIFQVLVDPETNERIGEPVQVPEVGVALSGIRRVSFSGDGKKLAYSALLRREGLASIPIEGKTGMPSGPATPIVENTNVRNNFPAFSPDGKRLAFASCNIGGTDCDIWLSNADGSDQVPLTSGEGAELLPSWFPDMKHIAYLSSRSGHWTVWSIDLDTKRERLLLDLTDSIDYARLARDGRQLAFNFKRGSGLINIWTDSVSGGALKQLTFDAEMMGFPAWSPDSSSIAFQMKRGDSTHVMVMAGSGGPATQLTSDKGQSWIYDWSPDGDKVLFAALRDGIWNVRWVSRSSRKQQQLTNYTRLNSFVRYPVWSPKNDQVVYEYTETTGNIWVADLK